MLEHSISVSNLVYQLDNFEHWERSLKKSISANDLKFSECL